MESTSLTPVNGGGEKKEEQKYGNWNTWQGKGFQHFPGLVLAPGRLGYVEDHTEVTPFTLPNGDTVQLPTLQKSFGAGAFWNGYIGGGRDLQMMLPGMQSMFTSPEPGHRLGLGFALGVSNSVMEQDLVEVDGQMKQMINARNSYMGGGLMLSGASNLREGAVMMHGMQLQMQAATDKGMFFYGVFGGLGGGQTQMVTDGNRTTNMMRHFGLVGGLAIVNQAGVIQMNGGGGNQLMIGK